MTMDNKGSGGMGLKISLVLAVVLLAVAAYAGIHFYRVSCDSSLRITVLEEENRNSSQEQAKLTGVVEEITGTINEIGAKLRDVREKRTQITTLMPLAESDSSTRSEILNDISMIENQLVQDKSSLEEMEQKLKNSGLKIRALETMIKELRVEISESEIMIAELTETIARKDSVIEITQVSLSETKGLLKTSETRYEQTRDLLEETRNTAWFISGSPKELQEKRIIDRFGIFSKKNALSSQFDVNEFSKVDISTVDDFMFESKPDDIDLVPPRDADCYSISISDEGKTVLSVLDRDKFWKVPYLVVVAD